MRQQKKNERRRKQEEAVNGMFRRSDLKHTSKMYFYIVECEATDKNPPGNFYYWLFTLNCRRVLFNLFRWSLSYFRLHFYVGSKNAQIIMQISWNSRRERASLLVNSQISAEMFVITLSFTRSKHFFHCLKCQRNLFAFTMSRYWRRKVSEKFL